MVPPFRWYITFSPSDVYLLGFTTFTSTALLFAKDDPSYSFIYHMTHWQFSHTHGRTPSAGILCVLWPILQRRLSLTSFRVLILLIITAGIIPLHGVIGLFAPHGARWSIRVLAEMFVIGVYFGALYRAFQSIPPNEEARWYGLFSITYG